MTEARIPFLLAHSPEKAPPRRWWSIALPAMLAILGILVAHISAKQGVRIERNFWRQKLAYNASALEVRLRRAVELDQGGVAALRLKLRAAEARRMPSYLRAGRVYTQWDGQRYAEIVNRGYFFPSGYDGAIKRWQLQTVVWFPLYPVLGIALRRLTGWPAHTCLTLIAELCTVLAAIAMFKFARRHFFNRMPWEETDSSWHIARRWDLFPNDTAALWSTVFLLFGPASIFMYVNYTESLFALLLALFLLAIQSRFWFRAAIVAALASAAAPQGALFAPVLALTFMLRTDFQFGGRLWRAAALGFIGLLGLLAYMAFLGWRFGDPFAFLHGQSGWHVGVNAYTISYCLNPVHPLSNLLNYMLRRPLDVPRLWEAICVVAPPVLLLLLGARFLSFEQELLGWMLWGLPYVTNCLASSSPADHHWMSMGRFMQVAIPLQIIIGSVVIRFRWLGSVLLVLSASAFTLVCLHYGMMDWAG